MKLAPLLSVVSGTNILPADWHVAKKMPKCGNDSFRLLRSHLLVPNSLPVTEVKATFDMNKSTKNDLKGLKVLTKQGGKMKPACKAVSPKMLRNAPMNDDNTMEISFSCKKTVTNEVELVARGKACPVAVAFEAYTDEVLEAYSEWSDYSECKCPEETKTRSRTCEGVACKSEVETETVSCAENTCVKCDPGYESINNEPCVDIDECQSANACAENAICTNSPGSFECNCEEGLWGDGYNFCMDPAPCHPGGDDSGCTCDDYGGVVNMTTFWNTTQSDGSDNCQLELIMNEHDSSTQVGSWKMNVQFELEASVTGLWRAETNQDLTAFDHTFYPRHFNLNGLTTSLKYHINIPNVDCNVITEDFMDDFVSAQYCTSVYTEPTTTTTTTTTTTPITVGPVTTEPAPELVLGDQICDEVPIKFVTKWNQDENTLTQQFEISLSRRSTNAHDWSINLNPSDSTHIADVQSFKTVVEEFTLFLPHDWNKVLPAEKQRKFGFMVTQTEQAEGSGVQDDEIITLHPTFCYKPELTAE